MSRNTLWQIAFGDYDFALDRRALTYNLTETKTGTIWAEALPVGWLELEDRETSERVRHSFADMKLVSLSEKSGQQGKRILLGLDCRGVPVDLYFICSQKEIQLTVEASRDTRTHRVQDICLLPGLVSVPDDGVSYLVVPIREGAILRAADAPAAGEVLPIWDAKYGVTMPFIGTVKNRRFNEPVSALALITDSAYGAFHLRRGADGGASLGTHYTRDPERRRLDIRIVVLPEQNHVGVARAYRNKIIIDRNHVTLRQKMRERPEVEKLIGATVFFNTLPPAGFLEPSVAARYAAEPGADAVYLANLSERTADRPGENETLWDSIDSQLEMLEEARKSGATVGVPCNGDWSAIACDFWAGFITGRGLNTASAPLYAVVYHDSVAIIRTDPLNPGRNIFLRSVLGLSLLGIIGNVPEDVLTRAAAVLGPLHRLSFAAFISEHRYLTLDFNVEEARYTNGTYVLINQSYTDSYENENVSLPPLGFYVAHPQMIAHDALRVGNEQFSSRAFRIARSQDGKPLTQSADVLRQEFPV